MTNKRLLTNTRERDHILRTTRSYENAISLANIDKIKEYCSSLKTSDAGVGNDNVIVTSVRKGIKSFINPNKDAHWIFQLVFNVVSDANTKHWGFDLSGCNSIQYTAYEDNGDHYNWHTDLFFDEAHAEMRKLSVIVPLTDPSEYQGGEFQIRLYKDVTIPQPLGTVIMFPSFVPHRITPIISGRRESLVFWFIGPKFK